MPSHRTFLSQTLAMQKAYEPTVVRAINRFRKRFIQDLQSSGKSTAISNLNQATADEAFIKSLQLVFRKAGLYGAKFEYANHERYIAMLRRQEQKAAGFGRNEQWIQFVLDYLRFHMVRLIQRVTDTMRSDIVKILEKGQENGWSIEELVKELKAQGLVQTRARVIARTEIIRAANVGHVAAAKSLPYEVDKKWSAAKDSRTRHSHELIHGHTVGENDFFRVPIYQGDKNTGAIDEMQHPGDPDASPGNTINCRCRALFIPKRDANGKLILRNRSQAQVIPMRRVPTYTDSQIAAQLKAHITVGVD